MVDVKQKLDYASAEYLKEKVVRFLNNQNGETQLVVIKGEEINSIDYTVAMVSGPLKAHNLIDNNVCIPIYRILSR